MSKGGTTSQSTQIPAYLEDAARENINRARDVSQIGYVPYYGPDVAAFSPMQQQSMRSTGNAASAFGLAPQGFDGTAGIPQAQTFAGGVQGYSSAPLYEQSLDKLFANAPAQYNAMNDMFIDPFTGARSRNNYGNASPVMGMAGTGGGNGNSPYGNDANIDHLNRMKEQGTADVYNSIYRQNMSGDLVRGDTFVGDDGLNYTVGYDVGQVDPALANAVQRNKINEVRSNSSAIGSIVGNTLQGLPLSRLFEGITGIAPFNSNDAPVGSLSNADVRDGRFGGLIGYKQENLRAQSDAARRQAEILTDRGFNPNSLGYQNDQLGYQYDQRGDMYPPQVQGGLLGNDTSVGFLESGQQFVDQLSEQEKANLIQQNTLNARLAVEANERAQAENQRNIAAAQEAAIEDARAAAAEQARIAAAQRSTVNGGGDGRGASQRATTGGQSRGTVGSGNGNAIRSGNGNAIRFGR